MSKDYYKILGVDKNAKADEIKKAFRKKAHEHHPDKGNSNADKFKEANEAYQVLGNAEKRKQYDQFGSNFDGAQGFGGGQGGFNWSDFSGQGGNYRTSNVDFGDLGDIFGDLFSGRSQTRRASRGHDIEASISINLEEVVFGTEKILDITKNIVCAKCKGNGAEPGTKIITCKTCKGSGQVTVSQTTFLGAFRSVARCPDCEGQGKVMEKKCSNCNGRGMEQGKERVKIKIPAGISNGETLRLSEKGEAGSQLGKAGDLYINIRVLPHRDFARQGDNLLTVKTINFSQASLGDKVKVKTLDGDVNLKIPQGTSSGQQFIIKGKGVGKLRVRGRGDLVVEVKVLVPKNLSRKQKKLMEDLQGEGL